MILRFVVIFLLSWRYVDSYDVENISIESVLDQVAIPTRIIDEFLQKPVKSSPTKKFLPNENVERTTVHYENSNGFIPLIYSSRSYELKHKINNSTKTDANWLQGVVKKNSDIPKKDSILRTDTMNSSNQNRRSFDTEDQRDQFELLKVNNGTPSVANIKSFYDNSKDAPRSDDSHSNTNSRKYGRNRDRDRGKRVQTYTSNFYTNKNNNDQHVNYGASEPQKTDDHQQEKFTNNFSTYEHQKTNSHQQEKFTNKYNQDNTGNYQSEKMSLPRTNYATITGSNANTYTSNGDKTNTYKFQSPIVIEPSGYTMDVKLNGQSVQSTVSTSTPQADTKTQSGRVNAISETKQKSIEHENTGRTYDYADSRDFSDETADYMDGVQEKPRRIQKASRKRPSYFVASKTLPKEHRETYDDVYENQGRKRPKSKTRNRYQKSKPVQVVHEEQYESEDDNYDYNTSGQRGQQNTNTWNQITPNVEVSHSNGFEINQIEKPKLHIVPVNILSNFDHATALDNSQGFDISNAMITGFVHEGTLSTAAPLVSSPNYLDQNSISSSTSKPSTGYSTAVPDVIVGQNSFQNPVQAFLMPNKLQQNLLNQYAQSTVSPAMFAVTQSPSYISSSTISPNLQQMINQVQASLPNNQQFVSSQSQRQSSTDLHQSNTNDHENTDNSNHNYGRQRGRNTYSHKYSQSTTPRSYFEKTNPTHKKKYDHNNGQFLASASLSVDNRHSNHRHNNHKRHRNNNNNHNKYNDNDDNYNNNYDNNDDQNYDTQNSNQQTTKQNLKNIVQPTIVPAILHTGIGLINNQNQQLIPSSFFITNPQQNSQMFKITGISNNVDSIGGASNNVNAVNNLINPIQKAQLPILGAKNVEIINPNMNTNGNTNLNAIAINQIPAALVTTPIPIFTTTGFIASKQAFTSSTQDPSNPDKLYNPINFVPNYDLVRSQSILNANVAPNEQFSQQNLNLVPLIPGGNFYKNSQGAQLDLASKPKLSSDLEKYAEEMFKESLRTMYNSHKWSNDVRNISLVDNSELARLRNELLRIKSNIRDSKVPKDVLEAHHTEHKIRTVRPGSDYKRPDSSAEHSHKHKHHSGHNHPRHHQHKQEINDFLTPPKVNSFISKSPFHDKPPKKRPSHGPRVNINHDNNPRQRLRPISSKPQGSEAQASSIVDYRYPVRPHQGRPHYSSSDYRRSQNYNYPSFTTSFPENDRFRASMEYKSLERDTYDMNNQRTHNLMGLLMKTKQLPPGLQANGYSDKNTISQYFDQENKRTEYQAYRDVMNSFQKKSDTMNRTPTRITETKRTTEKNDGQKN